MSIRFNSSDEKYLKAAVIRTYIATRAEHTMSRVSNFKKGAKEILNKCKRLRKIRPMRSTETYSCFI